MNEDLVRRVQGTITLVDGTVSEFSISVEGLWQQWGADQRRLGVSVDAVEAMANGLLEQNVLASVADLEEAGL